MAENELDPMIDDELPDTPEDVAILYSWANIHGAKYRDFSASRREYRAQMRARAMEAQREAELRAAQEREEAAREQEEAARRAFQGDSSSRRAAIEQEEAAMRAEVERLEAHRHAEAAELARQAAEEAEREAEDARRRAREQAQRYAESEQRRRAFAGPQPYDVPGSIDDPYHFAGHVDPSRLGQSGVRSSGLTRSRGGSSASVRAVRPDSLPNPARLIRDEVPQHREVPGSDVTPAYSSDGRYDLQLEAEGRQRRYENRLFRDPLDPRFQSSSATRAAFKPAARSTDPNFIPPRHEDVREGVDREIFERIGAQELSHLQDEVHRVEDFNRAHRAGKHGAGHAIDPTVEQVTEPRPLLEGRAQQRAREDASARHHLHEEVERQMRHEHSTGTHRAASAEIARVKHETHRGGDEAWEREHAEAEARRKRERDLREESRIRQESVQREAFRRPVGARYQETQAQRESREVRAREVVERDQREHTERDARGREKAEAAEAAAREAREREGREEAEQAERELKERAEREARARAAAEREALDLENRERENRERELRERETRERAERAARENVERARAVESRAVNSAADSRERDASRRDRSREIRESMMSSAIRPVAGSSAVRAISGPSAIRPVSGASTVRAGAGASAIRPAAGYSGIRPAALPYEDEPDTSRPAWLGRDTTTSFTSSPVVAGPSTSSIASTAMNDTLQQSRERVAARWFALKELLGQSSGEHAKAQAAPQSQRETRTPTLCVISMAGGVGRTSMVATLGRTLSAMGEKVLLADTGSHGLLPYYFGARDLRPGVVRTFSPPAGSPDAPVYMVNFDTDSANYDPAGQDHIYSELQHATRGIHRVMLDLQMSSAWLVRRLAKASPAVLVPLAPDMNSVLGIQSVERILGGLTNTDGQLIQPFYVLNQFDASQPLHLDVREALRQKLGERLLPIVIRRSPAVAEALAEGMTVMDYAPSSAVTEDYSQLASWIRNMTAPAVSNYRGMRWSEG